MFLDTVLLSLSSSFFFFSCPRCRPCILLARASRSSEAGIFFDLSRPPSVGAITCFRVSLLPSSSSSSSSSFSLFAHPSSLLRLLLLLLPLLLLLQLLTPFFLLLLILSVSTSQGPFSRRSLLLTGRVAVVHVFLCLRGSLSYHRYYVDQTFPFTPL